MAAFYSGHSPGGNPSERTWNVNATYLPRLDLQAASLCLASGESTRSLRGERDLREDLVPWGWPRQLTVSPPQTRMRFCHPTPFAYAQADVSPEH
jgi:hypothetical protein